MGVARLISKGIAVLCLALVACGGEAGDDGSESFAPSSAGSGQQDQARPGDDSSSSPDASQSSTDGGDSNSSTECDFHGPYHVVAVLTSGPSSCTSGAEYESATLQTRNESACSAVFCFDGLNCVPMQCERGAPVPECSTTVTTGRGCVYEWTMTAGG